MGTASSGDSSGNTLSTLMANIAEPLRKLSIDCAFIRAQWSIAETITEKLEIENPPLAAECLEFLGRLKVYIDERCIVEHRKGPFIPSHVPVHTTRVSLTPAPSPSSSGEATAGSAGVPSPSPPSFAEPAIPGVPPNSSGGATAGDTEPATPPWSSATVKTPPRKSPSLAIPRTPPSQAETPVRGEERAAFPPIPAEEPAAQTPLPDPVTQRDIYQRDIQLDAATLGEGRVSEIIKMRGAVNDTISLFEKLIRRIGIPPGSSVKEITLKNLDAVDKHLRVAFPRKGDNVMFRIDNDGVFPFSVRMQIVKLAVDIDVYFVADNALVSPGGTRTIKTATDVYNAALIVQKKIDTYITSNTATLDAKGREYLEMLGISSIDTATADFLPITIEYEKIERKLGRLLTDDEKNDIILYKFTVILRMFDEYITDRTIDLRDAIDSAITKYRRSVERMQ